MQSRFLNRPFDLPIANDAFWACHRFGLAVKQRCQEHKSKVETADKTRCLTPSEIPSKPLTTRDTLAIETPASLATSLTVGRDLVSLESIFRNVRECCVQEFNDLD